MGLVTRCPKCQSEYEVTADQLKLHDGLVRCGQCAHVFDGLTCLKDALPTLTRKVATPSQESEVAPPSTPVLNVLVEQEQAPVPTETPVAQPAPQPVSQPPAPPVKTVVDKPSVVAPAVVAPSQNATNHGGKSEPQLQPRSEPVKSVARTEASPPQLPPQGPFVPNVDRLPRQSHEAYGRQEPALRFAASGQTEKEANEPTLGKLDPWRTRSDEREPHLGPITPTVAAAAGQAKPEPAVRVIGESRVKGDDPSAFGRTVPEFLEDEEQGAEGASTLWLVGSVVLVLVLIIQSLVVFRNDLVANVPSLRPLLVQLCQPLSCEVGYVRQINRIFILGSSLQQASDAAVSGNQRDYVLRLTLQNRAAYPQPWPALMLDLTDASGTVVIKRALLPSEFLPPDLLDGPMQARQELALEIPLTVNGLSVSGYELERFFP